MIIQILCRTSDRERPNVRTETAIEETSETVDMVFDKVVAEMRSKGVEVEVLRTLRVVEVQNTVDAATELVRDLAISVNDQVGNTIKLVTSPGLKKAFH